jgi:hypothetical protein
MDTDKLRLFSLGLAGGCFDRIAGFTGFKK